MNLYRVTAVDTEVLVQASRPSVAILRGLDTLLSHPPTKARIQQALWVPGLILKLEIVKKNIKKGTR